MGLRATLAADLAVFLDPEDFGEVVVIDGVAVTAVRDDDLTIRRTQGPPPLEGVYGERTVLFVRSAALTRPVEGQRVEVAGQRWYVERVSEAEGMLELTLLRHAS